MRKFLVFLADSLIINLAIIVSFVIKFGFSIPQENFLAYKTIIVPSTLVFTSLYYIYDLYSEERPYSPWEVSSRIISASFLGILAMVTLSFAFRSFAFPRIVIFLSWILITSFVVGWRVLLSYALPPNISVKKILLVGINSQFANIAAAINNERGRDVVLGYVSDAALGSKFKPPYLGTLEELDKIVKKTLANHIIVTSPVYYRKVLDSLALSSLSSNIKIDIVPDLYEILIGRMDYSLISDVPLITLTKEPVESWVSKTKGLLDVFFALVFLLFLLPVILIIVLAIKLTSKGRVFYAQKRVGENERLFNLIKFRSMFDGAEDKSGPVLASHKDIRTTPVGRFLRRWRLDELPQLINVLIGDMSFVGPRPERSFFVEKYKKSVPGYEKRFVVKPGITGLAQVSGHYTTSAENKLKYDLIYISNQSLLLDLRIMLQTIRVVVEGKGVN